MTDAGGPGSHVLFQDLVASAAQLSFDLFIGNRAGRFATPNFLDFSTPFGPQLPTGRRQRWQLLSHEAHR
jgi:hypothetical protein